MRASLCSLIGLLHTCRGVQEQPGENSVVWQGFLWHLTSWGHLLLQARRQPRTGCRHWKCQKMGKPILETLAACFWGTQVEQSPNKSLSLGPTQQQSSHSMQKQRRSWSFTTPLEDVHRAVTSPVHRAVTNPVPSQSELQLLHRELCCEMLSSAVSLGKTPCLLKVLELFHDWDCLYCWERSSCLILLSSRLLSAEMAMFTSDIFCLGFGPRDR